MARGSTRAFSCRLNDSPAMNKKKILIQLDSDALASSFDSIVAFDSGVDQLLRYSQVGTEEIEGLVHGAIFTRGPEDLKNTALFFGGSDVELTEQLVEAASGCFFGPLKVSWMSDPNGSNTTAAAAVLSAEKHGTLQGKTVTILGGTGPVGQRIAKIIASQTDAEQPNATKIRICSRRLSNAALIAEKLQTENSAVAIEPFEVSSAADSLSAIQDAQYVFSAGAAGIELLSAEWTQLQPAPEVIVDLNAVPPAGISGVNVMDKAEMRGSTICYGAIGVGGLKMKIHKRCIGSLFDSNDITLDVNEIYAVGREFA